MLSEGYEHKDRDAVVLYPAVGVLDLILVDPRAQTALWHQRSEAAQQLDRPAVIALTMECILRVDRTEA